MKNTLQSKMTEKKESNYWFWSILIIGSILIGIAAIHITEEKIQEKKVKTEQEAKRLAEEAIPGF